MSADGRRREAATAGHAERQEKLVGEMGAYGRPGVEIALGFGGRFPPHLLRESPPSSEAGEHLGHPPALDGNEDHVARTPCRREYRDLEVLGIDRQATAFVEQAIAGVRKDKLHVFPNKYARRAYYLLGFAPWLLPIVDRRLHAQAVAAGMSED